MHLQAFRHSGIQAFRHSGIQAFRHSGIQAFKCLILFLILFLLGCTPQSSNNSLDVSNETCSSYPMNGANTCGSYETWWLYGDGWHFNQICSSNAACIDNGGIPQCQCNSGYYASYSNPQDTNSTFCCLSCPSNCPNCTSNAPGGSGYSCPNDSCINNTYYSNGSCISATQCNQQGGVTQISPSPTLNGTYGTCNQCPSGQVVLNNQCISQTACTNSPNYGIVQSHVCALCPLGQISQNGACTACPDNNIVKNNTCVPCQGQTVAQNNKCVTCGDVISRNAPGASACAHCKLGGEYCSPGSTCSNCCSGQFATNSSGYLPGFTIPNPQGMCLYSTQTGQCSTTGAPSDDPNCGEGVCFQGCNNCNSVNSAGFTTTLCNFSNG